MPSKAQSGLGYVIEIGGPTPVGGVPAGDVWTKLGNFGGADLDLGAWNMEKATNFDSVQEESIPTIQQQGSVALSGQRVSGDTGQILLVRAFYSKVPYDFRSTYPKNPLTGQINQGDVWVYSAYVISCKFPTKIDGLVGCDMELRIVGTPAFTLGS